MAFVNQIHQPASTFHLGPPIPGTEPANYTYAPVDQQVSKAGLLSPQIHEVHEKQARSTLRWKLRKLLSDFWVWEAAACIIALAIAAVIGQQLKALDGNSTANWTQSWSPTSALALAVTIAKAAMLVPVASAISQLKWHNYKKTQKLDKLETFDGASRGVLGSLKLLWEMKCWHFACTGAAIVVCALSLDALTQNAVRVVNIPYNTFDDNGVHRSSQYTAVSSYAQRGRNFPSSMMLPSLYFALSSEEAPDFQQALALCPSTNCTFGLYDSIAVDYQCVPSKVERSGQLIYHGGVGKNDDAVFMNSTRDIVISNTTLESPPSGLYKELGPLIARWIVLANPSTSRPAPQAMECAFYWTVKKYSSNVTNGIFYEDTVATYTNKTATDTTGNADIYIKPDECWRDNISYPITTQNCTNRIGRPSHESLQTWFSITDNSLTGWAMNDTLTTDDESYYSYTSIFMQTMISRVVNGNATTMMSGVNATAAALTSAITSTLRQHAELYSKSGDIYGASHGTTIWSPISVYVIQWKYLIFPAAIVALSTLFFVGTVFATRGDAIWKSSQLALIFHGLLESDTRAVGNVAEHATMKDVGKDLRVQLVETELGKKLQVVWRQGPVS